MQRSHPITSASPEGKNDRSDSEGLEEMERETLKALQAPDFNLDDLVPPAIPLMPKAVLPQEPIRPAFSEPLLYVLLSQIPLFLGEEPIAPHNKPADRSTFPAPFPLDMTLRKLFQEDVVYRRTPLSKYMKDSTRAGFYNARFCDVKKLIIRVHAEERRNFEGTFPKLITNELLPYVKRDPGSECETLEFESRFESGNLEQVARVSETEYNLLLQNDINSKGHTQWFFFKVSNARPAIRYKFNIVNFVKPDSLFNSGMRTLIYSLKAFDLKGVGWQRGGDNFLYYPNGIMRENSEKQFYTLSFVYQFQYADDQVYFAYSFPYTYSQLSDYLDSIESDHVSQQ